MRHSSHIQIWRVHRRLDVRGKGAQTRTPGPRRCSVSSRCAALRKWSSLSHDRARNEVTLIIRRPGLKPRARGVKLFQFHPLTGRPKLYRLYKRVPRGSSSVRRLCVGCRALLHPKGRVTRCLACAGALTRAPVSRPVLSLPRACHPQGEYTSRAYCGRMTLCDAIVTVASYSRLRRMAESLRCAVPARRASASRRHSIVQKLGVTKSAPSYRLRISPSDRHGPAGGIGRLETNRHLDRAPTSLRRRRGWTRWGPER